MLEKVVTVLLVTLVINLTGVRLVYADSKEEKQARFAEKIKANVLKPRIGESTRVKNYDAGLFVWQEANRTLSWRNKSKRHQRSLLPRVETEVFLLFDLVFTELGACQYRFYICNHLRVPAGVGHRVGMIKSELVRVFA